MQKKGSGIFSREVLEVSEVPSRLMLKDALCINQNHLLYFLLDHASYELQGRRDYMEDRCISIPRYNFIDYLTEL